MDHAEYRRVDYRGECSYGYGLDSTRIAEDAATTG
jgi:hypothetical protein